MAKTVLLLVVLVAVFIPNTQLLAQEANATQIVTVELAPTIRISSLSSLDVQMNFNNINNYISGVQSSSQQFQVHSNKNFVVSVRTNAESFSYTGSTYPAPQMPVYNTLFLAVSDNNTGGDIANSFNTYTSLSNTPKDLLLNCKNGGSKTFSINYKANPGPVYPAGDYTVGVIYTATQP